MAAHSGDLWDRFWKDGQGNYVIYQTPNLWLVAWAIVTFISLFIVGRASMVLSSIGLIFLAVWSVLEITAGVNYFRRLLGAVVIIFVILNVISLIR